MQDFGKKKIYIADGGNTGKAAAQIIIGEVVSWAARSTGPPPGYDIYIAHVDRGCDICNTTHMVKPIPLASVYPKRGASAHWVYTAGTGGSDGRAYAKRQALPHQLEAPVGSSEPSQPCRRHAVLMKPPENPLQIADTSGSPVFILEGGQPVLHGFHGNGEGEPFCKESEMRQDGNEYMCEVLQLVANQKEWIQKKITEWTGRTAMIDACTGKRENTVPYNVTQYSCRTDSNRVKSSNGRSQFHRCNEIPEPSGTPTSSPTKSSASRTKRAPIHLFASILITALYFRC